MALNFPGPYELRIGYTCLTVGGTVSLDHTQRLNVDLSPAPAVGTPFSSIQPLGKNGPTPNQLDVEVEAYLFVMLDLFHAAPNTTINSVELWKIAPLSFEGTFISSYNPTNNAGTSTTANKNVGQAIFSFRTAEGGILKLSLMECHIPPGLQRGYAALTVDETAFVDKILDTNNMILGRDTSYPTSFLSLSPGNNEALFKKVYRA